MYNEVALKFLPKHTNIYGETTINLVRKGFLYDVITLTSLNHVDGVLPHMLWGMYYSCSSVVQD